MNHPSYQWMKEQLTALQITQQANVGSPAQSDNPPSLKVIATHYQHLMRLAKTHAERDLPSARFTTAGPTQAQLLN